MKTKVEDKQSAPAAACSAVQEMERQIADLEKKRADAKRFQRACSRRIYAFRKAIERLESKTL